MPKLAISNIGTIASGDINQAVLEGNTIVIEDGLIKAIGDESLLAGEDNCRVIDAGGATVIPGLFDSHVHVTLGDFGHRQLTHNFIDSALHGGVTSMISAGEVHTPGRPKDPAGTKALALLTHKSFNNLKPSGVKVHAGALILEKGLVEKDFEELAAEGVWLVGEVGLGSISEANEASEMVAWAHKNNFKVQMHTGGTSIPGSSTVTAKDVMTVAPDVVSHINGGPTAVALYDIDHLMDDSDFTLEIVQCGNPKIADYVLRRAKEKGMLDRIIFGNDAPSGTGVIPLGILRNISFAASISDIDPADAICMATGNTARTYGLNTGIIEPGREADLLIIDAPMGSVADTAFDALAAGDLPGLTYVLIDGEVKVKKSRNTPPSKKATKEI